jgi:membrane-bound lytic murein transglycosylase MltF
VKRGYARGWEPVRFVENIRGYIDILDWVATDTGPASQRDANVTTSATSTVTAPTNSNSMLTPRR